LPGPNAARCMPPRLISVKRLSGIGSLRRRIIHLIQRSDDLLTKLPGTGPHLADRASYAVPSQDCRKMNVRDIASLNTTAAKPSRWLLPMTVKIALLVVLLILTNLTFFQGLPFGKLFKILGLLGSEPATVGTSTIQTPQGAGEFRVLLDKLLPLIPIWAATGLGLAYAMLDGRLWLRLVTAAVAAASTGFTALYEDIAGAPLTFLDIVSMWNARHEAGRAIEQFQPAVMYGVAAGVVTLLLILWPTRQNRMTLSRLWRRLWIMPAVPLAVMAGVYYNNNGFYHFPLPGQFNSAALGSLLVYQLNTQETPTRAPVTWSATNAVKAKHIIVMVDESIGADFVDLRPGNEVTPRLATLAEQFVDFGPAASGGVCSNYSNALLRFGASRKDIATSVNTNATLFAYAKKAGYRTVFIDAQAYHVSIGHKMQNFMTLQERSEIDGFYAISTSDLPQADFEMADIIAKELESSQPVFIYANKNGAHFPYDSTYPKDEAVFQPTQSQAGDTLPARMASYRNAIRWSVDKWMEYFLKTVDLSQAVMIYTGDHAQRFVPGKITHCQTTDVDPTTAAVPLLVYAPAGSMRDKFAAAAPLLKGRASHFQIAPTVYALLGYDAKDIATGYDESLLIGTQRPAQFTIGDVFGLFGNSVQTSPVELSQRPLAAKTN
jgi:glucan phosphoethanolaminetransferase (alkaline phosphatase superfamily)